MNFLLNVLTFGALFLSDGWDFHRGNLGGPWEAVREVKAGKPESAVIWEKVQLPHCFNGEDSVDPDCFYYQGHGWYRTNLKVDNPYKHGRTILHFEGAGQKTEVYAHTILAGKHVGGYDEWEVDITDAVDELLSSGRDLTRFGGGLPLLIHCDNSRDLEMIPSDMSDFSIYGGIYRPLRLEYRPSVNICESKILTSVPSSLGSGSVEASVSVSLGKPISKSDRPMLAMEVKDPSGKIVCRMQQSVPVPKNKSLVEVKLGADLDSPLLWSPSNPQLYTCRLTISSSLGEQTVEKKIGFRHFEFKEKGPFHLNGERLLLRGTHRHEDHALVAGAMTDQMQTREMKMIRDMGANFIRLGHYQQSDRILQLCDSLGLIVWEEIPWCRGGVGGPLYQEQAHRMLHNMICQHAHHPSIVMWSMGNENDWPGDFESFEKDGVRAFMKSLHDQSHSEDPTRVTCIRRCDFAKDIIDVYSPSMWPGWYSAKYTMHDYQKMIRENFETTDRLFHAEWGGDSHAGRHDDTWELKGGEGKGWYSETYIVQLVDWYLHEQEHMDWFTGSAFWTFKDFCTPLRPDNPVPYVNQKGAVARDLTPKEIYYVFQSYWATEPMLHIYGHTWPVRWGDKGEKKKLLVYSNAQKVELFLNGASLGVRERDNDDYPAAGFHWEPVFAEGANIVRAVARGVNPTTGEQYVLEDEICFDYQTDKWGAPAKVLLTSEPLGEGRTRIHVQAVDERGVKCLDAREFVRFSLAGRGKFEDNAGTPWASRRVQLTNGRASIVVDCAESCVVGASVDGLAAEFIQIQ